MASEFVGTSITLSGVPYDQYRRCLADNPHVRFFESRPRGYVRRMVDRQRWRSDLRLVDTSSGPAPDPDTGQLRRGKRHQGPQRP